MTAHRTIASIPLIIYFGVNFEFTDYQLQNPIGRIEL